MNDKPRDDVMAEVFQKDPAYAIELLNEILQDGDEGELRVTLRQMAKAFGGVSRVAELAQLSRTQLYRTLSPDGNPAFGTLATVLKAMGLCFSVRPLSPTSSKDNESLPSHAV